MLKYDESTSDPTQTFKEGKYHRTFISFVRLQLYFAPLWKHRAEELQLRNSDARDTGLMPLPLDKSYGQVPITAVLQISTYCLTEPLPQDHCMP